MGRQSLVDQAGFSRLVMVFMNRGHAFADLDSVKSEISAKILELAPTRCSNFK